ncbi:glucose-1-phosphate thymidylyltransferase [Actinokineospora auranticolor]|uniref:Glucose-1-phosphate thymidylyltransferase n=1 Tax=Actinokineospora auranticolor TaxID=155976 RepID=A0A2S6GUE3_9PSEU|nr:glucose-1-phosphate thymidylyltransferase [Actinokineospora auranticolor]PPK68830.1 glucose-1-phosphate thymidylyltransferase [Actinokineospora auranticolor]
MKALVLAGGSGTRLRPLSYSTPKQLVPIANRPVLEHVLANLRALGITEVGVVVDAASTRIQEALGDGSRLGLRVTAIPQVSPLGLAHCVAISRAFLGDDDFVMYLGDNVLPDGIGGHAERFAATRPDAQVVVRKVADPRAFGVAEFRPDGTLERLVEKPARPRSDLALIGVYFFTAAVHRAVAAIEPSARGELEITDAIQWLIDHGGAVDAVEHTGYWRDVGQVEDVLECNRRLLEDLVPAVHGHIDSATELRGPVVIEAGARVVRTRIEGPALIGAGTVVEDCHIGPGTSIGRGCAVRGSRVRDSVVMDDVSIAGPTDLRDSVIGHGATISLPPSAGPCSLVVGAATRIEPAA